MEYRLVVTSGAKPATLVLRLPAVLGRSPQADLKVKHHLVSRRHCEICLNRQADAAPWIKDLGSANGTYVNGQRISEPMKLSSGDRISLGDVTFELHLLDQVSGLPTPADATADRAVPLTIDHESVKASVHYQELDDGSFVGIQFGDPQPAPADSQIALEVPASGDGDVSSLDLHVGESTPKPADEDSALDDFLRGLGDSS